jgi:hypothetical protein
VKVWAVRLSAPVHFAAYVLQGDGESADRTWVCVRAAESVPPVSWLGCWSRTQGAGTEEVRKLLDGIEESIVDPVRVGPYGPTIGRPGHYESWDSWGAGTPLPIAGFRPWESTQGAITEISDDSLDFSRGGIEVDI